MLPVTFTVINPDYDEDFLPFRFNVIQGFPPLVCSFRVISDIQTEYAKKPQKPTAGF